MAGVPGLGPLSGAGLLGKCVYDNVKVDNIEAIVKDRDPHQTVIQSVLDETYSHMDLVALGQEQGTYNTHDVYRWLVRRWCHERGIKFNPYAVLHQNKYGASRSEKDKSDEAIRSRIKTEIAAYDEAEKLAKENYDAQPLSKKVDCGMLIGMCLATFGGIVASIKLFEVAPIVPLLFWFGIIVGWVQFIKQGFRSA